MTILLLQFIMASIITSATPPSMAELRALYYEAPESATASEAFFKKMESLDSEADPVILCYKGMAYMIRASHVFNPYLKLSYFMKGRTMMERAVKGAPGNAEIRFLRYCAQKNTPIFLGYCRDTAEDKSIVLKAYNTLNDDDLKARIKNYMLQ